MPYTYDHPRPSVTVDVVLFAPRAAGLEVLLIRRRADPWAGRWALPGGFLDLDEELETAARRELREETAVEVGPLIELGAWGTVGRDPRGRTISIAFLSLAHGLETAAAAGDDAAEVGWHPVGALPTLAFDHDEIIRAARHRLFELALSPAGVAAVLPGDAPIEDGHRIAAAILKEFGAKPTAARASHRRETKPRTRVRQGSTRAKVSSNPRKPAASTSDTTKTKTRAGRRARKKVKES